MERGEYKRIRALDQPVADEARDDLWIYKMKQKIDVARGTKRSEKRLERERAGY